jgi:glutamate-1-semialdehyde 2,1-aminomutase
MDERVVAIVQARLGSIRLPRKVLQVALGEPMIGHVITRVGRSHTIDQIVLAIPDTSDNDPLAEWAVAAGVDVYRGSEHDVLDRYYQAARGAGATAVVRVTGDCPLIDPGVIDEVVHRFSTGEYDYVSNADPATYPDGLDTEVFSMAVLEQAWRHGTEPADREHVTPYLRRSAQFRRSNVANPVDLSAYRWTLDEPEDLTVLTAVFDHFGNDRFTLADVIELVEAHPELFEANRDVARNEGTALASGQKLWKRAKQVIPGGSMLLSKRPEMLLPEHWPTYFSRAKGCRIWDLDDRELIDVSLMGVGTNILGYGHPAVDEAVAGVVRDGNLSTLNAPEEVLLAEQLVDLHPWSDMARFTRSGGEACAVAARIARAAAGRPVIAFCGYHGWHDWYLAANLERDALGDGQHLAGLEPAGVPPGLRGSMLPFHYNDLDELQRLVDTEPVGVIFMEVERSVPPAAGFLEGVRELATRRGIVLVFDECTSGFRKVLGGVHLHHGVDPDMAVFGKTLGNGYAINAILGRREVMEHAQDTFISSTFWTERIGSTAALASLAAMRAEDAPARIDAIGLDVRTRWQEIADATGVTIEVGGLPAISAMSFPGDNNLAYKTLITQEMLKRGYLATTGFYASIAHDSDVVGDYLEDLRDVFGLIKSCEEGRPVTELLDGPICDAGFSRLA